MRTRFLDWSKSEVRGLGPVRADRRPKRFPVEEACGFDRSGHFFIRERIGLPIPAANRACLRRNSGDPGIERLQ
jgi:hypothetical protein